LALDTAREALESMKFKESNFQRMGVFLGVGLDLNTTNYHLRWWWLANNRNPEYADAAGPALNADRTMGALASIAASRIAREYRVGGVAFTIAADENSGLRALEIAWDSLVSFQIDSALVGAVDFCLDPRMIVPLAKEGKLTDAILNPALAMGKTGVIPSDGSAVIVLKRLEDVSLLIKSEDLSLQNVNKVHNKILNDFDITDFEINHKIQKASNYWNPDSTRIYNSLDKKDKERILSYSPIDSEIYNTESLFYKFYRNSYE
jgi:hypothetical protein